MQIPSVDGIMQEIIKSDHLKILLKMTDISPDLKKGWKKLA
jgi:hypothetical protein